MRDKKIRGLKRKTEDMVKRIKEYTLVFPTEFYYGYWHMHLPVHQGFIGSDKTPKNIKRLCIQTLLDRAEHLIRLKPDDQEVYRVVVAIDLPGLWNSQIIIFRGDDHFKDFFNRNNEYQKWIPLSGKRNIQIEWGLAVPEGLDTFGFQEIMDDEDGYYESEIWFIGEIQ